MVVVRNRYPHSHTTLSLVKVVMKGGGQPNMGGLPFMMGGAPPPQQGGKKKKKKGSKGGKKKKKSGVSY